VIRRGMGLYDGVEPGTNLKGDMMEIIRDGKKVTVKPGKDIVSAMTAELRQEFKNLVGGGATEIFVDLTGVDVIDSVGLGLLISVYNSLAKVDGKFEVIKASKNIQELFKNMRLDKHFTVRGD
jgi:anti-sigma B factor antagonist